MTLTKSSRFFIMLLCLALAMLVIASFWFQKGEDVLLLNGNHSHLQDAFFYNITSLGNGTIILLLALPTLLHSFRMLMTTLISGAITGVLCSAIKHILVMPRPVSVLGREAIHLVFDVDLHARYSFPSGHTASAFCAVVVFALYLKNNTISALLISLALLVGLSRVYLAQHFIIDVTGGAMLGSCCGLFVYQHMTSVNQPWLDKRIIIISPTRRETMQPPGIR